MSGFGDEVQIPQQLKRGQRAVSQIAFAVC